MNWVSLLTSIEGRISRRPFWIALIPMIAIEIAVQYVMGEPATTIATLLLAYPQFAVLAKRGHDRNVPTWVAGLFVGLDVIVSVLSFLGFLGDPTNPGPLLYAVGIPLGIMALILLIDFGFRRGTVGANRYGPDPLDKHQ